MASKQIEQFDQVSPIDLEDIIHVKRAGADRRTRVASLIESVDSSASADGGNVGAGEGFYAQKVLSEIQFKSILTDVQINTTDQSSQIILGVSATSLLTPVETETSAFTLAADDNLRHIRCDWAANTSVTVPLEASMSLPVGFNVVLEQKGAGTITIAPEGAVVLQSADNTFVSGGQYSTIGLQKTGTNTWQVIAGSGGVIPPVVLDPIYYWDMDTLTNQGTLAPAGDLIEQGSVPTTPGLLNAARSFDNSENNYLNSVAALLSATGDWAVSTWIKRDSGSNEQIFLSNNILGSSQENRINFGISSSNKFRLFHGNTGGNTELATFYTQINGVYDHVVFTRANNTLTAYVNGRLDHAVTSSITLDTAQAYTLGRNPHLTNHQQFEGELDEFKIYDVGLSSSQAEEVFNEGYPLSFTRPDLILAYTMDNISGSDLIDESSNSNNGVITGATAQSGLLGNALSFDGSNDFVEVDSGIIDSLDDDTFSLSCWVKPGSSGGQIFSATNIASFEEHVYISYSDTLNQIAVVFRNGTGTFGTEYYLVRSSDTLPENLWSHIVVTVDGVETKIYVNGNESASTVSGIDGGKWAGSLNNNPTNVFIGKLDRSTGPLEFFDGDLDQLRVFDSAISQEVVDSLYAEGVKSNNYGNLVAKYNLFNNTSTVVDSSPNNYDLSVTGSLTIVPGAVGDANNFNGNTRAGINSGFNLPLTNYTASFWMRKDGSFSAGVHNIYGVGDSGETQANNQHKFAIDAAGLFSFFTETGSGTNHTSDFTEGPLLDAQWHHYVIQTEGTTMRLYRDGLLRDTQSWTPSDSTSTRFYISANPGTLNDELEADMDHFRIFDEILTPVAIRELYFEGTARPHSFESHWSLDEGSGTSAAAIGFNPVTLNFQTSGSWGAGIVGSNSLVGDDTEYLSAVAANNRFGIDSNVTLAFWINIAGGNNVPIMDLGFESSANDIDNRGLFWEVTTDNGVRFRVRQNEADDGYGGENRGNYKTAFTIPTGENVLVICERTNTYAAVTAFSTTNDVQYEYVDLGGTYTLNHWSSRMDYIGARSSNPADTATLILSENDRVDNVTLWKRVLTSEEKYNLWNNGNGITF